MADLRTISGWGSGTWNGITEFGFIDQGSVLRFEDQEKTATTLGDGLTHNDMTVGNLSGIEILFELDAPYMSFEAALSCSDASSSLSTTTTGIGGMNGYRFYRYGDTVFRNYTTDGGATWNNVGPSATVGAVEPTDWGMSFTCGGMLTISKIQGYVHADPAPTVADPFNPNAVAPAKPGTGCATLLDLIREFSGQVRRAVRITGPASIGMVDPNEPLPAGFTAADGTGMYSQASQQLTADDVSLSALKGRLTLSMGASVVVNDMRVVDSGWRIPDRLPVYGLDPAAVQRVSYTFTPREFRGTVEFRAATVPLSVRR